MDIFLDSTTETVTYSDKEKAQAAGALKAIVLEGAEQGISLIALKNARINRPLLFLLAKEGNSDASAVLTELNLRAILEEAKNPDTKEEVATEMLAKVVLCNVPSVRKRAIHILLKVNPDKLFEVLGDISLMPTLRMEIYNRILEDEELSLRSMLRMLRHLATPSEVKDKIMQRIMRIRKMIEENSSQIIEWNHRIDDLEKRKRIKFHNIEQYYEEVKSSIDEFKTIPNIVMDLKFDVEIAYENLKSTIKSSS